MSKENGGQAFKWEPWKSNLPEFPEIDIPRPPCEHCAHWRPQPNITRTKEGITTAGVVLCHADDRWNDFSCFAERSKP